MKQNENSEKSVIQKVAEEMLVRLAKRATACSEELEGAVSHGCRSRSVKIQGYIAGVMESAMKVSDSPEGCVTALIGEERAIEDRIGESDSLNAVLFLHGKQRAVLHAIEELRDLIVSSAQDPAEEEDPRSYLEDEDGNRTYLDPSDQEEEDTVQAPKPEKAGAGHPMAKRVDSEAVLQWAYEWGGCKDGVDIPVADCATYFWEIGKRDKLTARKACQNFLYSMAKKGALEYAKEGRAMTTFRLLPEWRTAGKKLPPGRAPDPAVQARKIRNRLPVHPTVDDLCHKDGDEETKAAIDRLDIEALSKIARETDDGEEG